MKAMEDMVV